MQPAGMGRQATIMLQVTNKELRDKIAKMNQEIGGWKDGFDPFYGAPAMIIVLAKRMYRPGSMTEVSS